MSERAGEGGQAKSTGEVVLGEGQDSEEATPLAEDPAAIADLIRRIATDLDVDNLKEEELIRLSESALHLASLAKALNTRKHKIASLKGQVDDWEARHSEAIAGVEVVNGALAALRERIDQGQLDAGDVSTCLDLAEQWISVDAGYRTTHKDLKRAAGDADFESVRALTDHLESLAAKRSRAHTALHDAFASPSQDDPTPDPPDGDGDGDKCFETETGEGADGLDEVKPLVGQAEPSTVDPSQSASESTASQPSGTLAEGVDGEPDPEPDDPSRATRGHPTPPPEGGAALLDDDDKQPVRQAEDAIAMSIEQDRIGLAYHLSRAVPDAFPSPNAIKLAAYGHVTEERAPVTAELTALAVALLQEAETVADASPGWHSHAFFTTCAALEPALAAPGGPVAQLLAFFEPWLDSTPSLRELAKAAADVSMTGVHLPADLLRGEDSLEKWRARRSALHSETKLWIKNERQSTIKFQAATKVWRRMLEDWKRNNGQSSIGRMFSLMLDEAIKNVDTESVTRIAEYWRANGDKEIDRIDRDLRSWKQANKIQGSARLNLRNRVNRALAFSDRWLRLMRERPDNVQPFHTEQARILRTTVRNKIDSALAELEASPVHGVGASRKLLRRYAALFNSADSSIDRRALGLTDLLNGDLLAHPEIVFGDTGEPSESPVGSDVLQTLVTQATPDFGQAAVARARRGDFLGAEAAVKFAELTGRIDDASADLTREAIEKQREQIQSELEEKTRDTSSRLDGAYAAGALTLGTYDQQRDRIPQGDFSEINIFEPLFTTLMGIDQEVADAQAGRRNAIRKLLANLDPLSPEDRERIESAVDSGRFQVAEDFIERIERNEELPTLERTDGRPFDRFFPGFVENYASLCDREGDGIVHARNLIDSRDSDDFIDARELSEDGSRDGVDLLEAWAALRDGHTSIPSLGALMNALGFAPVTVQRTGEKTLGEEVVFALRTAPITDRSIVQLPEFGSRADGKYRLFAVRRRKTEEAIIREAGRQNGPGRPPNIVLFFGTLDVDARRSLAREFRNEEYHPTIVLDESLVVFLAAWRGNRLSAFFDCVSAFFFSQPFEPDAAELPPEMFFGRAAARREILAMSHDMKHFVYGGRRLGKTTLLSDIAREYRKRGLEEPQELVLLINLKGSGIGENRPTEDLWPLFAKTLAEYEVVGSRMRVAETIGKSIKQWLGKVQGRRILLLVDEADAFLGSECKPKQDYRVLEQVKRLMEETERRFKVVFAGLHNVQRAARDPNTPFAHLGEAIRIGPMLPENDGDAIQDLIRGPLEALGCRFVSDDSVVRIAAETNYYPALAQQFCKELLKSLREESYGLSQSRTGPPYRIHRELVDRVFSARETRDRIRNLFSWTIHLDHRYEFLTYLIAQKSFDNEEGRPQAMSIAAIRDAALSEWPKGFADDSSFWTFEVLLEEMIGLGILREAANKEYAIRTRNLRSLLGNDDQIERRFRDAKSRKPPRSYDPAQFRSTLGGDTLSSLTAHQETRLLSGRYAVGLVFGTRLAGLHRVGDSLRGAAEKRDEWLFREEVAPGGSPRPALRRALQSRKPGVHVVLLDMNGAWDSELLGRVLAFVGKHEWQDRIIRPVFLCGPEAAWKWLSESVPSKEGVEIQDVWLAPCGRDFTSTWLKGHESRVHRDLDKSDGDMDLPWPVVVEAAARKKQLESIHEATRAALEGDNPELHVGDVIPPYSRAVWKRGDVRR